MVPYKFGATITSNWDGFFTSCIEQLSTIIYSYFMKGYFFEIPLATSKNKPSTNFMILALWMTDIFFLPLK